MTYHRPNISLSALSPSRIPDPNCHTRYIPPHPQRGSPYHRYVCLLLPQPPLIGSEYTRTGAFRATSGKTTSVELDIPVVSDEERLGFDIRKFAREWNLDGAKGGGVHMWREVWDDDVSHIYRDVLGKLSFFFIFSCFSNSPDLMALSHTSFFLTGTEEPVFGHPPKVDAYADVKQRKRYIS